MELGCPTLWLAAEPLELTELAIGPAEKAVFWHCSVCGGWHGKQVSSSDPRQGETCQSPSGGNLTGGKK